MQLHTTGDVKQTLEKVCFYRDLNFERYSIEGKEFEYYKKLFFQDVDKVFVGRAKDIKKAMDINNQKRKEIKIFL